MRQRIKFIYTPDAALVSKRSLSQPMVACVARNPARLERAIRGSAIDVSRGGAD